MNPSGETPDWQQKLKEDIGENPVRFLDHHIPKIPESPGSMFRARVEGIDCLEVVGAWQAAERKLAVKEDRQPREHVLQLLEARRDWLLEHGERPENLRTEWPHELPDRYQPFDREVPEKECYITKRDGERVPYSQRPTTAKVSRSFESSTTAEEVATDGGVEQ